MRRPADYFRKLFELDAGDLARVPRLLLRGARTLVLAIREFYRDQGLEWAASLAYSTLFALVPLGILAFSLLDVFEQYFDLDEKIVDLLLEQGLPETAAKAGEHVRAVIDRVREGAGRMGVLGTLFLILAAMALFTAMEKTFNRLWKTRERRNPVRRFRAFWVLVTLGPAMFGLSLYTSVAMGGAARFVGWLIPLLVTWAGFFFLYAYLPNGRVRFRGALLGAVLAGSVWEVAKRGFNLYVANAAQIDKLYGPLGILPLFVLWIYITWVILLVGLEIAYVDQNFHAMLAGVVGHDARRGAAREYHALRLMVEVYRAFRDGSAPPDQHELARKLVLRTEAARDLLEDLRRANLVRRDRGGLYMPAREARSIRVIEVVAAVRGSAQDAERLSADAAGGRVRALFERGEEGRYGAFADTTLDDLLETSE